MATGLELSQAEYCCRSQKKQLPQEMVKGTTTRWPFCERALRPGLDHAAHELVAEDVAGEHAGDHPVVEVQVRAADRRRGHLDDGVAGVDDLGVGHGLDADVVLAVPGEGAHRPLLSPWGSRTVAGGGDLARLHQHLEALELAAALDVRLALEELGDPAPELAARRPVGDRRLDDRAAAAGRVAEGHAPLGLDLRAWERAPGDQLALALLGDLAAEGDARPRRRRDRPLGVAVVERSTSWTFSMKRGRLAKSRQKA